MTERSGTGGEAADNPVSQRCGIATKGSQALSRLSQDINIWSVCSARHRPSQVFMSELILHSDCRQ
jgi:hypothetical protein